MWGIRAFERLNLYAPDQELGGTPDEHGLDGEEVLFTAEDGTSLHGCLVRAKGRAGQPGGRVRGQASVILYFHGNAGNLTGRFARAAALASGGFDLFLFDYRGYGKSRGRPSEKGLYQDGRAAARWLIARGVPPERTAYYGESLGCAVALQTALELPPGALVLDSGFTSVKDMARVCFPRIPLHLFVTERYDNIAKVAGLRSPLLIVHSAQDELIPISMAERMFAAAPEPKRFLRALGEHNDPFLSARVRGVCAFLHEHLRAH
jgi:hypothetical protein